MATTETHRSISDRFDVTESSVGRIVWRCARSLNLLAVQFIRWPVGRERANTLAGITLILSTFMTTIFNTPFRESHLF